MSYEAVDDGINAWAARHGLPLSTEFGGRPHRYCYVSAGEAECFRVSIEEPADGTITVSEDAVLHRAWQVPVAKLSTSLDEAMEQIAQWSRRRRRF
ncbi:hypothetical protein LJR164_000703 [Phenylobacterium sp. LjRoot164]|uniref:hypothetical protein n=1 Tax=unclassified Phenylobacterium TaxID=2640670 RepID=UPI003ECCA9A0